MKLKTAIYYLGLLLLPIVSAILLCVFLIGPAFLSAISAIIELAYIFALVYYHDKMMEPRNIYIAGKVSGLTPEEFHKKFEDARSIVKEKFPHAKRIMIPMDVCQDDWEWDQCMEVCMDYVFACDALVFMDDWKDSRGANAEHIVAKKLNKRILYLNEL